MYLQMVLWVASKNITQGNHFIIIVMAVVRAMVIITIVVVTVVVVTVTVDVVT